MIFGAILLSGCSYHADFVLVNASEKVLIVQYSVQTTKAIPFVQVKGRLASREQHEANDREFNAFPEDRISISPNRKSARVQLNPGEVLFLTELDIRDIADEPLLKSGIRHISIRSDSGSLTYEGDRVFRQFEPSRSRFWPGSPLLYTLTFNE